MTISTGIYKFDTHRYLSQETLNTLSLFIEELAGNVVQHAFKPGEKRWLDLTIIDTPEKLIIRIRDNGSSFDPMAYLSTGEAKGYGLLIIQSLADKIDYRRSMGLNNLIIISRNSVSKRRFLYTYSIQCKSHELKIYNLGTTIYHVVPSFIFCGL